MRTNNKLNGEPTNDVKCGIKPKPHNLARGNDFASILLPVSQKGKNALYNLIMLNCDWIMLKVKRVN